MYLKLLDCEFQKYEDMTMPVVISQKTRTYIQAVKHIKRTFLISDYCYIVNLFNSVKVNVGQSRTVTMHPGRETDK